MIYTVFVENTDSTRSFCKIATRDFEIAIGEFTNMVEYFTDYCRHGTNFRTRTWSNDSSRTYIDCRIIECNEHKHIIHFDKFEE